MRKSKFSPTQIAKIIQEYESGKSVTDCSCEKANSVCSNTTNKNNFFIKNSLV